MYKISDFDTSNTVRNSIVAQSEIFTVIGIDIENGEVKRKNLLLYKEERCLIDIHDRYESEV